MVGIHVDPNDHDFDFTPAEMDGIHIALVAASFLSIIGAGFILITYAVMPKLRTANSLNRIVVWLAACDLIQSIIWIIGIPLKEGGHHVCRILGPVNMVCHLTSVLWTGCIAIELAYIEFTATLDSFDQIVYKKQSRFMPLYHLISWGIALASIIQPTLADEYEESELSCWVKSGTATASLTFIGVVVGVLIVALLCYAFAIYKRHKLFKHRGMENSRDRQHKRTIVSQTTGYIVIYILSWGTLIVLSAIHSWTSDKSFRWVYIIMYYVVAITMPLSGFLNAIVYGFNRNTRIAFAKTIVQKLSSSTSPFAGTTVAAIIASQRNYIVATKHGPAGQGELRESAQEDRTYEYHSTRPREDTALYSDADESDPVYLSASPSQHLTNNNGDPFGREDSQLEDVTSDSSTSTSRSSTGALSPAVSLAINSTNSRGTASSSEFEDIRRARLARYNNFHPRYNENL